MKPCTGTNTRERAGMVARWSRLAAAALALGSLAGCSGGERSQRSRATTDGIGTLLDRPATLTPAGPAAASYRCEPVSAMVKRAGPENRSDGSLRTLLVDSLRESGQHAGVTVIPDRRLDTAMNDLARSLRPGQSPRRTLVEFLLGHYGVVEPYPALSIVTIRQPDDEVAARALLRSLSLPTSDPVLVLGIGIERSASDWTLVVAMQPKRIELAPIPRVIPAGGAVEVTGKLLGGLRDPQVFVTDPDGKAHRPAVASREAGFSAKLACGRGGRYQVELIGHADHGPKVLANFPVFCGDAPPESFVGVVGYVATRIPASQAEAQLVRLINQARRRAGLAALTPDPALARVARGHSEDMLTYGFVGHISPRTGGPMDRARRAGLSPARLLENAIRASSAEEAHAALMRSPSHRAAILDPDVTHVGVGVMFSPPATTPVVLLATELFR